MIRLGITGGIGMGKTASTRILEQWGVPVADSDLIAREIVLPGQPALEAVRAEFGEGVLAADGTLDRGRLAQVVFADPAARGRLEAILHPRIRAEWEGRLERWAGTGAALGVAVIPLLFETGAGDRFDAVVCVACSAASQMERLLQRGWTMEECRRRIAAQMAVEEKMKRSRFVIWTEPPQAEHALQWERILSSLGISVGAGELSRVGSLARGESRAVTCPRSPQANSAP